MIPKKAVAYRRGGVADRAGLLALKKTSYSEYETILTPEHAAVWHESLHNEATLDALIGQATIFVCTAADEIVGMAFIIPSGNPTPVFSSEWTHIRMVGVHPQYRGQGIASMLTQMCIHHAKFTNEKTIALHTSEFMDVARHIYESLGFRVLKEIGPLYGKRYWVYTLDINDGKEQIATIRQHHEGV